MDEQRFDELVANRGQGDVPRRRRVLRGLLDGAAATVAARLGPAGGADAAAKDDNGKQ